MGYTSRVTLLRLDRVSAGYAKRRTVLRDVTLSLAAGEVCVVLGPNGAGKSTLVRATMGLLPVNSGSIEVCGLSLPQPASALARRIAWVPQHTEDTTDFTGLEVALMGVAPRLGLWALPTEHDAQAAHEVLAELDAGPLAHRRLSEVSGGERRRVWLARALLQRPQVLVLDEPTAFLDVRHQLETLRAVRRRAEAGLAILAVLHDVNLAAQIATHVVLLKDGAVLAAGPVADTLTESNLSQLYGLPMRLPQPGERLFVPSWPEHTA